MTFNRDDMTCVKNVCMLKFIISDVISGIILKYVTKIIPYLPKKRSYLLRKHQVSDELEKKCNAGEATCWKCGSPEEWNGSVWFCKKCHQGVSMDYAETIRFIKKMEGIRDSLSFLSLYGQIGYNFLQKDV